MSDDDHAVDKKDEQKKGTMTREELLKKRQAQLPGKDDMSKREIKAAEESVRELEPEDLVEKIGIGKYQDWEIQVYRMGPAQYRGKKVKQRRIDKMSVGMKWKELIKQIDDVHGYGKYAIRFIDSRSKVRKMKTIETDAATPKFDPNIYPEFNEDKTKNTGPSSKVREKEDEIRIKKLETEAIKYDKEIERLSKQYEEGGKNEMMPFVELMRQQATMTNEQIKAMREESYRKEQQAEQRFERLIQEMKDSKPRDNGLKDVFSLLIEKMESDKTMMIENMRDRQQLAEKAAERDRQQMQDMFKMFMDMSQNKSSDIDLMRILADMQNTQSNRGTELVKTILPLFIENMGEEDSRLKLLDGITNTIEKGSDFIGRIIQRQKQLEMSSANKPKITVEKKEPEEPSEKQKKSPKDVQAEYEEVLQKKFAKYQKTNSIQGQIYLILDAITWESNYRVNPEKSLTYQIVFNEHTKDEIFSMIYTYIKDVDDLEDFTEKLSRESGEEKQWEIVKESIFGVEENNAWMDKTINVIREKIEDFLDQSAQTESVPEQDNNESEEVIDEFDQEDSDTDESI